MLTTERIEHVLSRLSDLTVGVLGDLFLDRYLDIDAALTEPSIETGLDAYQVTAVRSYPGALGTVINNLVALGVGRVVPVTLIGDDGEGYELRQALARLPAVDAGAVLNADGRRTPTYTKPMLHAAEAAPRELNRLDIKNRTPTPEIDQGRIVAAVRGCWAEFAALIVLDQVSEDECGVVTDKMREALNECPTRFVLADSRERIGRFRGVALKPNRDECARLGTTPSDLARTNGAAVFCTHGADGIELVDADGRTTRVHGYPVMGPTDIVGAGDSTSAGIACAVAAGCTYAEAAAFGCLVASITVQQIGTTGTASPQQVRERWRAVNDSPNGRRSPGSVD